MPDPVTPTDEELLRRMKAGDEGAFSLLYRRRQGSVYRFALQRNNVLRYQQQGRSYDPLAYDSAEAEQPIPEPLIAPEDSLRELARREKVECVRQAILALVPHYREVVVLCDLHEMSYAEATSVLGCPVGTTRSRLHRAHALLTERLRAENPRGSAPPKVNVTRGLA